MKIQVRLYGSAKSSEAGLTVARLTLTDRIDEASLRPRRLDPSARFFLKSVESDSADLESKIVDLLSQDSISIARSTSSSSHGVRTRADRFADEPYGTAAYWLAAVGRLETELDLEVDADDWQQMVDRMEDPDEEEAFAEASVRLRAGWLALLDPDPVRAERSYDALEHSLTRFLEWQGHVDPRTAAHETLARGLARFASGEQVRHPRAFLFGVAKHVMMERARQPKRQLNQDDWARRSSSAGNREPIEDPMMLVALGELSGRERRILLRYYAEKDHRAHCHELRVTSDTLQVMVHQIAEDVRGRRDAARRQAIRTSARETRSD